MRINKIYLFLLLMLCINISSYATNCDSYLASGGGDNDSENFAFLNFVNNMSGPNAVSVRWSISNNPKKDGCQGAFTGLIGYTLVIPPGKDLVYAISANRNGNISGIPTVPQKGVPIQIVNNNTDCIIKTTIDWTDKVTKKNFTQTYTSTWNCPAKSATGNDGTVEASVTGGNVIQQ